jgi:hypothetical protein
MREDRVLRGGAAEEARQRADRPPVRDRRGHVRPLPGVIAFREQPAELVERARRRAQDAVRVVVDQPDAVQYFSK